MPLRDHFRSKTDAVGWDGVHGGWPMVFVQHLFPKLPKGYVASPQVHIGREVEVDVGSFERDDAPSPLGGNGVALWSPAQATLAVEAELSTFDEYEVRVYNTERQRRLVAAVALVSPSNKSGPEGRRQFAVKCAALLAKQVSVVIVDLVTDRRFNLYAEVLDLLSRSDPALGAEPPTTYAVSCRGAKRSRKQFLEAWLHPLEIGRPLPTLPLWLDGELAVPLDLETTYEETCRVLHLA